jgi:hypothetical protein
LPFSGVTVAFGSELLYFKVSVQRFGGVTQTVTDAGAIAAYPNLGVRHLTISNLLFDSDAYSLSLATYLVTRYSTPQGIVSGLQIPLHALGTTDRATVAALDIGDVITLSWTPVHTGGAITQVLVIEGVRYSADVSGDTRVWLQLSDARNPAFLVYDTGAYDTGAVYGF